MYGEIINKKLFCKRTSAVRGVAPKKNESEAECHWGGRGNIDLSDDNNIILCVCYWSLVPGLCPNYKVVEFQPWTVTPPKPRLHHLLLHSYYWPALPSPPAVRCPSGGGGQPPTAYTPPPPKSVFYPQRIIHTHKYVCLKLCAFSHEPKNCRR